MQETTPSTTWPPRCARTCRRTRSWWRTPPGSRSTSSRRRKIRTMLSRTSSRRARKSKPPGWTRTARGPATRPARSGRWPRSTCSRPRAASTRWKTRTSARPSTRRATRLTTRSSEAGGEEQGRDHRLGVGLALPGDIVGGAVIRAGARPRQAERDVHRFGEVEQLGRDQALIVVERDDRVVLAARRAREEAVGRVRAGHLEALRARRLDRRRDDAEVFVAEE